METVLQAKAQDDATLYSTLANALRNIDLYGNVIVPDTGLNIFATDYPTCDLCWDAHALRSDSITNGAWIGFIGHFTDLTTLQAMPTAYLAQSGVSANVAGTLVSLSVSGTSITVLPTSGVQGPQGPQGSTGATGPQGSQGSALADIQASTTIYVDSGYTGTTTTGTAQYPFKTVDAALASVTTASCIELTPGNYTSAGGTWPAYQLTVFGNGSVLTISAAATVTLDYTAYDLNVIAPNGITYSGTAATTRFILRNGSRKGPMALTQGVLDTQACTQTWNTTSDKVTVSGTGILTEIGCINTLPVLQSSATSVVFIENSQWNTARASTYLIESSAGQLSIANSVVANTSATAGGGIYIHNSQTSSAPNAIVNTIVGAINAINVASGITLYSKIAATGTTILTTVVAVPDLVAVSVGQVALPNLSQGTALTLAATTAPNILATSAFPLTLPAASATYRGLSWVLSSQGNVVTYSGTFKYSTAKGTWTSVSSSTYASLATSLLHYVYCDGSAWFISLE